MSAEWRRAAPCQSGVRRYNWAWRSAMALDAKRRRFMVEEYHRMAQAGILGEDDRVELIEGEIPEDIYLLVGRGGRLSERRRPSGEGADVRPEWCPGGLGRGAGSRGRHGLPGPCPRWLPVPSELPAGAMSLPRTSPLP